MIKSRHILRKFLWAKYIKEKRVLGKYTIDKSIYIYIYTKINNIEKSGQRIKEERGVYPIYIQNTL